MKSNVITMALSALKFSLLVLATTIAFAIMSSLLPFSEGFRAANKNADPGMLVYVLLSHAWICLAIVYTVRHAPWKNLKLILALTSTFFLVYSFMTQIETYFFRTAFKVLTTTDIFWIMIANGTTLIVGVPLGVKFFGNGHKQETGTAPFYRPTMLELILKLVLIGISYMVVYFVFGYFVAWRVEDLRIFYSGHSEDNGFVAALINNYHENPIIYPFQFMRGVLFGLFVLPLVKMFAGQSRHLLISLVLIFSSTGIALIIPNFLFPDTIRWAHFKEMMSSMFMFASIVWLIYTKLTWPARTK